LANNDASHGARTNPPQQGATDLGAEEGENGDRDRANQGCLVRRQVLQNREGHSSP
jgi:hypothetical protein